MQVNTIDIRIESVDRPNGGKKASKDDASKVSTKKTDSSSPAGPNPDSSTTDGDPARGHDSLHDRTFEGRS